MADLLFSNSLLLRACYILSTLNAFLQLNLIESFHEHTPKGTTNAV